MTARTEHDTDTATIEDGSDDKGAVFGRRQPHKRAAGGGGGMARTDAAGPATPGSGSRSSGRALVSFDDYVRVVVAAAPELTGTQIQELRDLLVPEP
jgi:hypothetical protein